MRGIPRNSSSLEAIGNTPMIELPSLSPTGGGTILAKWEGANPTGSLKDRMALAMIEKGRETGALDPGEPVVEFTGGSTGTSLALVCAVLDHPLSIVTADCVADEKIASMRALGGDLHVVETPNGKPYSGLFWDLHERALDVRDDQGAYFTDQFNNTDQLEGYRELGAEILDQTATPAAFTMSVGTGGCAMGTSKVLYERGADTEIVLVEPRDSPVISEGKTGPHPVQGTALVGRPPLVEDDRYDRVETVGTDRTVECVRRLAESEGLLAGTSTGMNVAAARTVAAELEPEEVVVTVVCDTGLKYLSDDLFRGNNSCEWGTQPK